VCSGSKQGTVAQNRLTRKTICFSMTTFKNQTTGDNKTRHVLSTVQQNERIQISRLLSQQKCSSKHSQSPWLPSNIIVECHLQPMPLLFVRRLKHSLFEPSGITKPRSTSKFFLFIYCHSLKKTQKINKRQQQLHQPKHPATSNAMSTNHRHKKPRKSICLFGTSANPPTGNQGHVGIVRALSSMETKREQNTTTTTTTLKFDEVRVVPVYSHPYAAKRDLLVPFEHRLEMCKLAFCHIPNVTLSRAEESIYRLKEQQQQQQQQQHDKQQPESSKRGIRVGTADLLEYYQSREEENDAAIYNYTLCLGMDTFLDLMRGKWRRTEDVIELVQGRFVVLYRKGTEDHSCNGGEEINDDLNTDNNPPQKQVQKQDLHDHPLLQAALHKLKETYGYSNTCELLHVPTLGAVSSSLVRSLSSELSLKGMEEDRDGAISMKQARVPTATAKKTTTFEC